MAPDVIKKFPDQFTFAPVIQNGGEFTPPKKAVLIGMGGSRLAAELLTVRDPVYDLLIHSDYGLPVRDEADMRSRLVILSSYSGNTEEVLNASDEAARRGLASISISVGGILLERARARGTPYIELPRTGIQPRAAIGLSMRALLKTLGREDLLQETAALARTLQPAASEEAGRALADALKGYVPIVYASRQNGPVAVNWKIAINEGAKIPAFTNVFPELNHNEMTGFDIQETTRGLSKHFSFIFLQDDADHPRIAKRMEVLQGLYRARGLPVHAIALGGGTVFEKIFSSLILARWTAYYLAAIYGVPPEEVPMVEEFKKLI